MNTLTTKPEKSLLAKSKTEEALELLKTVFPRTLSGLLQLRKVSAPMVVMQGTGINDDLNGIERPVAFPIKDMDDRQAEVVHSLAKWKRLRLKELGIPEGQGLLTDMRALRPDEELTPFHSIYVDQWDWEKHIAPDKRTLAYLKETARTIYEAMKSTEKAVCAAFPEILPCLPATLTIMHAEELLREYPHLSPKERESEAARKYGAFFLIGIGGELADGQPHDGRAPDYDDWSTPTEEGSYGLNGDLIVWHPVLEKALEISSMGIRVDREALERQLEIRDCTQRKELYFHQQLLCGQLTESIGGGIGQSRMCMFMLRKRHIGEVQVGIWPEELREKLEAEGIDLL